MDGKTLERVLQEGPRSQTLESRGTSTSETEMTQEEEVVALMHA